MSRRDARDTRTPPARVIRPDFAPGRRILAVSDIHGNLPFFRGLLEKVEFSQDDILVIVGDLLEKGTQSLELLRYIMDLCRTRTVYPLCGNCDGFILKFFEDGAWDSGFFTRYLPAHPESILRQLSDELGLDRCWEDLSALRRTLRENYPDIWQFLKDMPTILETEHLVFVHGGVPSLEHMERLDSWKCMKNDDFMGQGRSFEKYVVVGHWPVTLYDPHIPSSAPLIDRERKIISIDGGCVLKVDGQLNALITPEESSDDFDWMAYDGLPTVTALDAQEASADSVNIRWGRSALELLEEGEELSLCRHLESGRELWILNSYLRAGPRGLWCEDSTDYLLPVDPGDTLTLVQRTKHGFLCKKSGVTGWYFGRVSDIMGEILL